jgi:hypothetical protein
MFKRFRNGGREPCSVLGLCTFICYSVHRRALALNTITSQHSNYAPGTQYKTNLKNLRKLGFNILTRDKPSYINCSTTRVPIYIRLWRYSPLLSFGRFFNYLILYTVGRTPWTGDQSVTRPLPKHRTTQTQNKRTQSSMPRVRFERTIPVFELALDRAASVIGINIYLANSYIIQAIY